MLGTKNAYSHQHRYGPYHMVPMRKPNKGSVIQKLVTARSRIDFGLNKADEVALNFETIYRGKGNYFERMENLGTISTNFVLCVIQYDSYCMRQ